MFLRPHFQWHVGLSHGVFASVQTGALVLYPWQLTRRSELCRCRNLSMKSRMPSQRSEKRGGGREGGREGGMEGGREGGRDGGRGLI